MLDARNMKYIVPVIQILASQLFCRVVLTGCRHMCFHLGSLRHACEPATMSTATLPTIQHEIPATQSSQHAPLAAAVQQIHSVPKKAPNSPGDTKRESSAPQRPCKSAFNSTLDLQTPQTKTLGVSEGSSDLYAEFSRTAHNQGTGVVSVKVG